MNVQGLDMIFNAMKLRFAAALVVLLLISACTNVYQTLTPTSQKQDLAKLYGSAAPKPRFLNQKATVEQGLMSYHKDIKPILDSRCVACHACYDAPCQLKLGSSAGIDRGATKQLVYGGGRLEPASPTRLFIDASNTTQWREKDFYPVLNERISSKQAALDNSLLAKLLQLKRSNPLPKTGKLAESFKLKIDDKQECPSVDEFVDYKKKHPDWGMPYAMPGLSLQQEFKIMSWLQEGAKFDAPPSLSAEASRSIEQWERFFNRQSLKQQLVARYIYEHLFIGHLHFKGQSNNEFFRLVRSITPSGEAVKEIASRHPYDDPKVEKFYYRLRRVEETLVEKTHFVYQLSPEKMQRYEALFFQPDYKVTKLPSYQPKVAANPFISFAELPTYARYQFMLDDAHYFVSGFIKGPVCRGQIALGAIRDRFWITFFNPKKTTEHMKMRKDMQVFLAEQFYNLTLPDVEGDQLSLFGYQEYNALAEQYLNHKDEFANQLIKKYGGFKIKDIWDGNGTNKNATLTVFRHFDSATVVQGLVGEPPLTAWVVDYPLFERVHYLLVAGFDVYSGINQQLASRQYMDFLRIDGENNFLRLLPDGQRKKIHDSWYKGLSGKVANYINQAYYSEGYQTGVNYQTKDYKVEFFEQLKQRIDQKKPKKTTCELEACIGALSQSVDPEITQEIIKLQQLKAYEIDALPEMSLLRIRGETDLVYSLMRNKSLKNVAFMVGEGLLGLREKELDTLTVVPGFVGSYPNFFFTVKQTDLPSFIEALRSAKTDQQKNMFYEKYGIRRTNPKIWQQVDWFNSEHKKYRGIRAGLFDLNRYHNL